MGVYGSGAFGSGSGGFTDAVKSVGDMPHSYTFIDYTNVTEYIKRNTAKLTDQIQETTNQLTFKMIGTPPSTWQNVDHVIGARVKSVSGTTLTLNIKENCNSSFRVGERFFSWFTDKNKREGKTITSISRDSDGYVTITLDESFSSTPQYNSVVGKMLFSGVVMTVNDKNLVVLQNQEWDVTCVDHTRVFDKELINETYTNKTGPYMVTAIVMETVNYTRGVDRFDYADNSAIQAEWIESGDGDNPTTDTSDYKEGSACGVFPWTNSGGTATFTGSPDSQDYRNWTTVTSGTPTSGVLGFWYKVSDNTVVDSVEVRIGSDSSNYASFTFNPSTNGWVYFAERLSTAIITGTPDWTAIDYLQFIITETGDGSLRVDGVRVLENNYFSVYPFVIDDTTTFTQANFPRYKPTEVVQTLADQLQWYWYVDYERNIHFYDGQSESAPFNISETSDNFQDLSFSIDDSNLFNKVTVEGAQFTSDSTYSEAWEGDGIRREWILKNKFKNLFVKVDNNTSTDTMEAGTTTTTVNATAHGLSVGDFIVNRTRSNALRRVLTVPDPDSFTVDAVSGQTSGDTFSIGVSKDVGVEGLNQDAGYDYMSNFNEKSVRNADGVDTLNAGEFINFQYNEVNPITVVRINGSSINALQTKLGYSNGVLEGQKIIDKDIKSQDEARKVGDAFLEKWSNTIVTASFQTYIHGLKAGQNITITDQTGDRNFDQSFIIQRIVARQVEAGVYSYNIVCSSLLFGMLELLQQLLRRDRKIGLNEDVPVVDDIVNTEDVEISIVTTVSQDGDFDIEEEVSISDGTPTTAQTEAPYYWGTGSPNDFNWGFGEYS